MNDASRSRRLLAHAPAHAERIDVGTAAPGAMAQEAISYLLVEKAREGRVVARLKWGDPFVFDRGGEEALFLHEHGVPFEVDLAAGQKTGAFLDQRENRARVGALAASLQRDSGPRLLNLFSYAGGFSLHAALQGAKTTSVDVAPLAHRTAQASFKAAGVPLTGHAFVAADVYAFLDDAKKKGLTWDVVISDPPSFAPNEKSVPRALAAYRALHGAAAAVLRPGGIFCAASCSSHVGLDAFLGTLDDSTLARADLRVVDVYGPPGDHPSLPAFPEGRYLKLAVLR